MSLLRDGFEVLAACPTASVSGRDIRSSALSPRQRQSSRGVSGRGIWFGSEPLVNLGLGVTGPPARPPAGSEAALSGGRASLLSCRRAFQGGPFPVAFPGLPALFAPRPRASPGLPALPAPRPRASPAAVASGAGLRVLTTPALIAPHKKRLMSTFMTFPQIIDARELKIISHAAPYR